MLQKNSNSKSLAILSLKNAQLHPFQPSVITHYGGLVQTTPKEKPSMQKRSWRILQSTKSRHWRELDVYIWLVMHRITSNHWSPSNCVRRRRQGVYRWHRLLELISIHGVSSRRSCLRLGNHVRHRARNLLQLPLEPGRHIHLGSCRDSREGGCRL